MKILQINTVYNKGSTGRIVKNLKLYAEQRGNSVLAAHRFRADGDPKDVMPVSTWLDCHIHNRLSTITGLQGCFSFFRTLIFLRKVRRYAPDLIHLHNIHGSFLNYPLLFRFIKKKNTPIVWTLHDCWTFTGGCPHFVGYSCSQWETGCGRCPHFAQSKGNYWDTASYMWKKKKQWFTGIPQMVLVTPSNWLADLVGKSYLKGYPRAVIPNGIDLEVFKPVESDFRDRYGLKNRFIVLGVSFGWNEKKGLDVFIELANSLDENYRIVLVGTDAEVEARLPENILKIRNTADPYELAAIYSAADVFVNPTREDTYPTVNMEALACGTPVITHRTGGSPETIDEMCGTVVDEGDIAEFVRVIRRVCEEKPYTAEACLQKAKEHDMSLRYKEYVDLYEGIGIERNSAD